MNKILDIGLKIQELSAQQGGVFSLADLKNIIFPKNRDSFYRILSQVSKAGIFQKFCRGFYITSDFEIQVLSQRICPHSYLSFGNVLSQSLIIGSIPKYRLMSVKFGRSRSYKNEQYSVTQLGITEDLFMGFNNVNGINIATVEKAFLDTLYFYKKGVNFSFDIYTDIDIEALDKTVIMGFLKKYKDKRFVSFVMGLINE